MQKIEEHALFSVTFFFFTKILPVYETMWGGKNGTASQATDNNTIRRMRTTRCLTKATETHQEYVIPITFPQQQLLSERASVVRFAYIVCLINTAHIHFKAPPILSHGKKKRRCP